MAYHGRNVSGDLEEDHRHEDAPSQGRSQGGNCGRAGLSGVVCGDACVPGLARVVWRVRVDGWGWF